MVATLRVVLLGLILGLNGWGNSSALASGWPGFGLDSNKIKKTKPGLALQLLLLQHSGKIVSLLLLLLALRRLVFPDPLLIQKPLLHQHMAAHQAGLHQQPGPFFPRVAVLHSERATQAGDGHDATVVAMGANRGRIDACVVDLIVAADGIQQQDRRKALEMGGVVEME